MARIDGPRTTSPGQVSLKPLVQSTTAPAATPPAPASEFVDRKKKPLSMTGGFRPVPIADALRADLKSFVADQMRGAVAAKGPGTSLSLKSGDTRSATQTSTPTGLEKELSRKPMSELMTRLGTLSPAESSALGKAIQAGKVTDPRLIATFMQLQPPTDRAQSMLKLNPKQLEQMKALMRLGECPNDVAVGVGLRLAADSKWGKAHPEVIKTLQKSYGEGGIRVANGDADIAGLGMTSASGIDLAQQLRKSPEGLAATLAHEGVHQHAGGGCCSGNNDATPQGEIDGMAASAEVWGQLGNKEDPNLKGKSLTLLNEAAAAKTAGEKPFKDKVLGWYTGFYQGKVEQMEKRIERGDKLYVASKKPNGKAMPPDDLQQLLDDKDQLAYLKKTADAFQTAWKANG